MQSLKRLTCIAIAALSFGASPGVHAWTDKPVRVVVPAPPGGTMDVLARVLTDQLAADIGATVVVDNRPGAGGAIGVAAMLGQPADGQTIMVTASNVLTEIPHVLKAGFDPLKDVRPVTAVVRSTLILVAGTAVPGANLAEFVAYARANAGKLSIASYSAGTASHYAAMMLNQKAGLDLVHVPFPGSPPALAQVIGGQIPVMFDGLVTSLPQIRGGKLRGIALAARTRTDLLPQVPTFAELGHADMEFSNWVGFVAPGALSDAQIERINAAVQKAAGAPKVRERLVGAGFEIVSGGAPAALAQSVRAEHERNGGIVRTFGIKLNQ
ncbi:MAG: tripartite tricarboxylate transporter substrate binding protein [Burkholderiales bacterium]|nr:tripartite tricarboxylate transporter substrate binding protein [Burkholderiales bacterium]